MYVPQQICFYYQGVDFYRYIIKMQRKNRKERKEKTAEDIWTAEAGRHGEAQGAIPNIY